MWRNAKKRGKITPSVDDWRNFYRGNACRKLSCDALGTAQRDDDVFCQPAARAVPPVQIPTYPISCSGDIRSVIPIFSDHPFQ
nr:hypothetical protein [Candidatus Sodalis pierantonius]